MTEKTLKFGATFTKHMLKIEYDLDKGGWQLPKIVLFENLSLHPAAKSLQYGCEAFEGMKAYKGDDNRLRLFRPLLHLHRLNRSGDRANLPQIDVNLLLEYIEKLVYLDREFLPSIKDGGFYIRPTVISTDGDLTVEAGRKALLYVILSPCGPYFGANMEPLRVAAISKFVRAWPGGTGDLKMGGNYAPIIYVSEQIKKDKCKMILWLFGVEKRITEAGVMNVFMFFINNKGEKELRTPPLDTTILPGITRASILEITKEWNEFNVVEAPITLDEVRYLAKENKLLELMGVGTASIVCPISEVLYEDEIIKIPTIEHHNALFKRLYSTLSDIQYGRTPHQWSHIIDPKDF